MAFSQEAPPPPVPLRRRSDFSDAELQARAAEWRQEKAAEMERMRRSQEWWAKTPRGRMVNELRPLMQSGP